MNQAVPIKDHWKEQRLFLSRLIVAIVIILLLTGVLVSRLFQLQVLEYQRHRENAGQAAIRRRAARQAVAQKAR